MFSFESLSGSFFVDGVFVGSLALVLFALVRREVSVRPGAWWTVDAIVYIVFAPLVTVLGAVSAVIAVYGLNHWSAHPASGQELAAAGAAAIAAVALARILSVRQAKDGTRTERARGRPATVTAGATAG